MTRAVLTSIRIRNLALIDDLEIHLAAGLTVLTGETGAGKSIIVGALNLVLGDRASGDTIRQGADSAEVEALFELAGATEAQVRLEEMGLADDDGALVVRRIISRSGKNRVYLNGRMATLSDLKRVVGPMVDISSQHAHTSLLKVPEHRVVLDRFGQAGELVTEYGGAYDAWRASVASLRGMTDAEQNRGERVDFLRFQLTEIEDVDPRPGEEAALLAEEQVLSNASDLLHSAGFAEEALYSGGRAVTDSLNSVERELRSMADADPTLGTLAERVECARLELEDIALEARAYRSRVEVDPRRLVVVEERIDVLRRLCRKHGPDVEDVLTKAETMRAELSTLEDYEHQLEAAQTRAVEGRKAAERVGRALSEARRAAARKAAAQVETQLADLGMPGSRLVVVIEPLEDLAPHGADRVELMLSANVGEEPRPLARVASGGELSRIMLAIKHVLASAITVDCYVFDEVDTGVSGAIGDCIGRKLRETAATRQALCITHLPQVACHAHQQLRVHKEVNDGRTVTRVSEVLDDARIEEIARLLAGIEVTEQARAHARSLLDRAAQSAR